MILERLTEVEEGVTVIVNAQKLENLEKYLVYISSGALAEGIHHPSEAFDAANYFDVISDLRGTTEIIEILKKAFR